MTLMGKCEAQYANNLFRSKRLVLRTDRDNGGNPYVAIHENNSIDSIIIMIYNDVNIEIMKSSPNEGAKDRIDIHFNKNQISNIINVLQPYVNNLAIDFDDTPRNSPDPTGMEHPNGLPLGRIQKITWIKGQVRANYADKGILVWSDTKIYIDAEKYSRGEKFHLGITMNNNISKNIYDYNCFELVIKNDQLKRFLHSFVVAQKWFN